MPIFPFAKLCCIVCIRIEILWLYPVEELCCAYFPFAVLLCSDVLCCDFPCAHLAHPSPILSHVSSPVLVILARRRQARTTSVLKPTHARPPPELRKFRIPLSIFPFPFPFPIPDPGPSQPCIILSGRIRPPTSSYLPYYTYSAPRVKQKRQKQTGTAQPDCSVLARPVARAWRFRFVCSQHGLDGWGCGQGRGGGGTGDWGGGGGGCDYVS